MRITIALLFVLSSAFSVLGQVQPITVKGCVIDKHEREPVWNAYVSVKGDSVAVIQTDENGYYSINAGLNDILVFSIVGYNTQEIAIGGRTTINVEMDCEDCGWLGSTKGLRQPAHDFSAIATYAFDGWGYGLEYAYLPQISRSYSLLGKTLRYADFNFRAQSLPYSSGDVRFFPHVRISAPFSIPLFTTRQKLYPFVSVGYYFDTDFSQVRRHDWGVGGGFKTRLAFIDLKGRASRYMVVSLVAGYTAYMGVAKKDNIYLGLKFYLSRAFIFE